MSPPRVGVKYGSIEQSLYSCSLLLDEGLENEPYELENNNMAIGYEQNEGAE